MMKKFQIHTLLTLGFMALLLGVSHPAMAKAPKPITLLGGPVYGLTSVCNFMHIGDTANLNVNVRVLDDGGNGHPVDVVMNPGDVELELLESEGINRCEIRYTGQPGEIQGTMCSSADSQGGCVYLKQLP